MKYNVISYFLGEGFRNVFKNKKSTFSCLGVMCATMFMFGIFFAIGQNINNIVAEIEDSQAIRVFALQEATQEEIDTLGEQIRQIELGNVEAYDPTTGEYANVSQVIMNVYDSLRNNALTVTEFEALDLTATDFDALDVSAYNFDVNGKTFVHA